MNFLVTMLWEQEPNKIQQVTCWHISTAKEATARERAAEIQSQVTTLLEKLVEIFQPVTVKSLSVTKL